MQVYKFIEHFFGLLAVWSYTIYNYKFINEGTNYMQINFYQPNITHDSY